MPTTVREQCLAAFYTVLSGIAGVTTYRNRRREVPHAAMPAFVQVDGGHDEPSDDNSGRTTYQLQVSVEGFVTADTDALLGPALSDHHGKLVSAVLADRTLGGLAIDVREGPMVADLDRSEGSAPAMAFNCTFTVDYWTVPGDPYTVAP